MKRYVQLADVHPELEGTGRRDTQQLRIGKQQKSKPPQARKREEMMTESSKKHLKLNLNSVPSFSKRRG